MSNTNPQISLPGTNIDLAALGLDLPNPDEPIVDDEEDDTIETPSSTDNPSTPDTPENPDATSNNDDDDGLGILNNPPTDDNEGGNNDNPDNPDSGNDDNGGELATLYYNNLVDNGFFDRLPEDFEFDGSFEGLQQAQEMQNSATEAAIKDAIWYNMPDELKSVVEYGLKGGTDINDFMTQIQSLTMPEFDITTESGQESAIKYYYKQKGVSDRMIESTLNTLEQNDQLEQEAQHVYKAMERDRKKYKDDQIAAAEKQLKIDQKEQKAYEQSARNAILANKDWNDNTKRSVYRTMFATDERGVTDADKKLEYIRTNPAAFAELVNFINHYDVNSDKFELERYFKISENLEKKVKNSWEKGLNSSTALKSKTKAKTTKKRISPERGPFSV